MLQQIQTAAHLIGDHLEHVSGDLGVTQGEAHVLAHLTHHGPTAIGELHRQLGHKRSTLTSILDRLERRKLTRRTLNPADRRSFTVQLTAAGERTGRRITAVLDKLEASVRARVTARDLAGLDATLHALAQETHRDRSAR